MDNPRSLNPYQPRLSLTREKSVSRVMTSNHTNPYDAVPYDSHPFPQTHPDQLATLAHIFGLSAPLITHCRVLELGCAGGGNLIPMAASLPDSQLVGVDLSRREVEMARETIDALGLANIRIEHASILDIDETWGDFDYIICHGVFSWVEKSVQDKIFAILSDQLTPNGIAYISYNTYPGWHMREAIREMMRYHSERFDETNEQIGQARALLDFLAAVVPVDSGAYGQLLSSELDLLRRCADWYLYHEHLEQTNTPLYFHQFMKRARRFGLQYLAEADFSVMLTGAFSGQVAETLEQISPDILHLEQYMDFVRNRHFRQTLLCRSGQQPRRALGPRVLHGLLVASAARTDASSIDLAPGVKVCFRLDTRSRVETDVPGTKAALAHLAELWPRAIEVDRLCDIALDRAAAFIQSDRPEENRRRLMEDLFRCFLSGLVELHTWQAPCASRPSDAPVASRLAAFQAREQGTVVNACHELVALDALGKAILPLLDGTRDRDALGNELLKLVLSGSLDVTVGDEKLTDEHQLRTALAKSVDETLTRLSRDALLIA